MPDMMMPNEQPMAAPAAPAQSPQGENFAAGLATLSPEERMVVDQVIDQNPQFVEIIKKAWPYMAEAFRPFEGAADGGQSQPEPPVEPQTPQMGPTTGLASPAFRR